MNPSVWTGGADLASHPDFYFCTCTFEYYQLQSHPGRPCRCAKTKKTTSGSPLTFPRTKPPLFITNHESDPIVKHEARHLRVSGGLQPACTWTEERTYLGESIWSPRLSFFVLLLVICVWTGYQSVSVNVQMFSFLFANTKGLSWAEWSPFVRPLPKHYPQVHVLSGD